MSFYCIVASRPAFARAVGIVFSPLPVCSFVCLADDVWTEISRTGSASVRTDSMKKSSIRIGKGGHVHLMHSIFFIIHARHTVQTHQLEIDRFPSFGVLGTLHTRRYLWCRVTMTSQHWARKYWIFWNKFILDSFNSYIHTYEVGRRKTLAFSRTASTRYT